MSLTTLEPPVQWTLLGVFALLAVAQAIVWTLRWIRSERDWAELERRIATWWIIAAVFALALLLDRAVAIGLFAVISFLALKEFLSLVPTRRADRRVLFWAYLAIPLQYWWVYREWYGMFIIFIPVYVFLFLPLRMLSVGPAEGFLRAAGTLHWGLMTTVFSLSHVPFLLVLRMKSDPEASYGPGMVVFLVVLTELNDVAQYLWGKSLGRRKVLPAISPGKTWAGWIGGIVTTAAVATLLGPWLTPLDRLHALVAGLIIGVAGFVGDVNISALKRDLGIKDSGSMLPGHGGILDRVDSLTYTAPLFFHYMYYLFVWHTHGAL
ncbi:MAG: phosphatidate cytidylyltransferase [Planctomycetales bacterium]